MSVRWMATADGASPWPDAHVVIAGMGVSGFAAADGLLQLGALVTVLDDAATEANADKGALLEVLGATVRLGPGSTALLPEGADLVITTGFPPRAPILVQALAQGVLVWSEVELAWRLSQPAKVVPWLGITGTNGKTTTTQMLAAMLTAAGLKTAAVGNIGRPVMEIVLDPDPYDVLAVELSSHQLHWSSSLALHSAAVLNLQPDHLEWHGGYEAYGAAKAKIYEGVSHACVYNVADRATEAMVEEADVVEGARAIGFTLGTPAPSMVGIVDDLLVDRAFIEQRRDSALELASLADVALSVGGGAAGSTGGADVPPHVVANALAAAALARAYGVPATAVRDGLRNVRIGAHKIATVAERRGVRYVDDSKATNPHAANAALRSFGDPSDPAGSRVVWVAGGQAKGTRFDDLVTAHAPRLRAAVLLGVDAPVVAQALARHAPDVPVHLVRTAEDGPVTPAVTADGAADVMARVVATASSLARPGDVVLLAPGCASLDMFADYAARGDAFTEAVRALAP